MKTAKHQRWMAGALCVALAACSSMDSNRSKSDATASSDGSMSDSSANAMAGTASSPSSASGAMNSASTTGSDYQTNNPGGTRSASSTAQATSYGIVQSIDSMQRQDVAVGSVGAAAAGGSMGAPTDKVYRVSVRMDDGTTQQVVLDNKPSYSTGDRVRYSNGMLEKN